MNDTPLPTAANFYGFEPAGRDVTTKFDVAIVPAMSRLYLHQSASLNPQKSILPPSLIVLHDLNRLQVQAFSHHQAREHGMFSWLCTGSPVEATEL